MRVLLCDAYRLFAEAFAAVLAQRGHDVVGVCFDPRTLPGSAPAEADVCVADFGRPGGDLAALTDAATLHSAKTLALTSEEAAGPLHALITAGVDGLISKRRSLEEIMTAIDRLHSGTGYYDPVLVRHAVAAGPPKPETGTRALTGALTPRELEVLTQLVRGMSTGGMAAAMGISVTTVRTHTQSVLNKLGVNSRLQAAACAVSYGLVEPPTA
ncbi:response regulator transcription factor [Catenulispora subtropica]|uniref:LuxR C-terminal-related transcriptional regulator n=1 Tax=Catenulispora subtropica TaxID=450798 RepID=A0ABP5CW86_9ACTN